MTLTATYEPDNRRVRLDLTAPGATVETTYRVERSNASASGPWTVVESDLVVPANGGTATTYDTGFNVGATTWYRALRFDPEGGMHLPEEITGFAATRDTDDPACAGLRTQGEGTSAGAVASATSDITGDLDARADVTLLDWTPVDTQSLIAKYDSGAQRGWILQIPPSGVVRLVWSEDGVATLSADSTVLPTVNDGERLAVRATLDVDDGAGNHVVTFYTGDSVDGPWTQLGTPVTTAGTTSIFDNTAAMTVAGHNPGPSEDIVVGTVHAAQARDGINGTIVVNPDFSAESEGTTSFDDSAGITWTITGDGQIVNSCLDVTGDIDLRVDATLDSWTEGIRYLVAKYNFDADERSYTLRISSSGFLELVTSFDGVAVDSNESTVATPVNDGERLAVRATLDADDGAGNHVATFYTAPTISGPWVVLDTVSSASVVKIYAGSADLTVGATQTTANKTLGVFHAAEVRDGIDGVVVSDPDFAAQATDTVVFDDSQGRQWQVFEGARLVNGEGLVTIQRAWASAPDSAQLDITGDIDVRVDASLDNWYSNLESTLLAKYESSTDNRSYRIYVQNSPSGHLAFAWSTDGTSGGFSFKNSTEPLPINNGERLVVRATLDVDDESGNHVVTFYTGNDNVNGPWTQLGDPVVTTGTTSIHSGPAPLEIGSFNDGVGSPAFSGIIHAAQVRDGIDGTIVFDADFEAQSDGTTQFTGDAGNEITLHQLAYIVEGDVVDTAIVAVDIPAVSCLPVCPPGGTFYLDPWIDVVWTNCINPPGMVLDGQEGTYASTPDKAQLDITGDLDLRAEIAPETWNPDAESTMVAKYDDVPGVDQRSFRFSIDPDGTLFFRMSNDGTPTENLFANSEPVPVSGSDRLAVRVTFDVDNGAGGNVITFYIADSIDGSWVQLGDPIVGDTVETIHSGSAALTIGARADGQRTPFAGIIHWVEVRDGIGGTIVANPNFDALDPGTTSFDDGVGNTWTLNGNAVITPTYVGENLQDLYALSEILGWEMTSALITDPNWGEFDAQRFGSLQVQQAELIFAADFLGKDARQRFRRRMVGYIIIFPSGEGNGGPFHVFPVQIAKIRQPVGVRSGSGSTLIMTCAIARKPADNVFNAWEVLYR